MRAGEAPLWCGTVPSAEDTLQRIIQEVRELGGPDLSVNLMAVLSRDPEGSVQSSTLRSAVASLLQLRELRVHEAAGGVPGKLPLSPVLQPWARTAVEGELYRKEVRLLA